MEAQIGHAVARHQAQRLLFGQQAGRGAEAMRVVALADAAGCELGGKGLDRDADLVAVRDLLAGEASDGRAAMGDDVDKAFGREAAKGFPHG
jgi:hypothetical protein